MLTVADVATAAGVVGGAIWATYHTISTQEIRNSILELKIEILQKVSDISTAQAMQSVEIQHLTDWKDQMENRRRFPPSGA